ncbi:MAG: PepSY domain-containing protein, partial [Parvibaculaceae bacterium]|nr:PepSY domain-containing protein [Parvibaculaceae bacterium]
TFGRFIVGLSGVLLLVSIVSGILLHRKMLKEMFTWRLHRSIRLKWQDSHKILGVWSLPFQLMIAFTGAWLGMVALLLPLNATITGKWGMDEIYVALFPSTAPAIGISQPMLSIDEVLVATSPYLDSAPKAISITNWGDETASYIFQYDPHGTLDGTLRTEVSAVTGEIYEVPQIDRSGVPYQVLRSMTTLHYGVFGAGWIKILYTVLGAILCIIAITGVLIWLEKRQHGSKGTAPKAVYVILGRLTLGTSIGMLLASFSLFYVEKLGAPLAGEKLTTIGTAYFAVWIAALLFAGLNKNPYKSTKQLFQLTGITALGIPAVSLFTRPFSIAEVLKSGWTPVSDVDVGCAIVGLLLIGVSLRLQTHRV